MWHPVPGPRISAYPLVCPLKWCVQRAESGDHRDNTNTAQPPQYGSCPRVRIICTKFQWYLAPKLGYSVWTSAEMWHNLLKSKLSINWKSQKLARTGNKLTCKTLLRLPSLDWRLTGTVSGVRAVSPVCQENSKTKSILLYLGLTVLPILPWINKVWFIFYAASPRL